MPGEGEVYILASRRTQWQILFIVLVPALAALAEWLTGFLQSPFSGYGFPLGWNECYFLGVVAPLGGRHCYLNQILFVLDAAFYTIIGCTIVLLYYRAIAPKSRQSLQVNSRIRPPTLKRDLRAFLPIKGPFRG